MFAKCDVIIYLSDSAVQLCTEKVTLWLCERKTGKRNSMKTELNRTEIFPRSVSYIFSNSRWLRSTYRTKNG